ncbi:MAG: helix-turn-helix transcriptional regulator [Ruminococcus sp.]|nr:helix-turn-helix transcriptional regulator [Ruminococcus sp.]
MILADKIINLRKKNGWSQEELAEKLNVSRQAVSKWEGVQSTPDLDKILQMSNLFGVTTDYLIKDEIEDEVFTEDNGNPLVRKVSLELTNKFLDLSKKNAKLIALGVVLCITCAIPLISLGILQGTGFLPISENLAACIGIVYLLCIVAVAVGIFLYCDFRSSEYEFFDKEDFETEYGVTGLVKEKQKSFKPVYDKSNIIATIMCVISPVPLIALSFTGKELLVLLGLVFLFLDVSIAVYKFVYTGTIWESMQKILREGEFTKEKKKKNKLKGIASMTYWLIFATIFFVKAYVESFNMNELIPYVVVGVILYILVLTIVNLIPTDKE